MNKHLQRALSLGLPFGGAMAGYQYVSTGRPIAIVSALIGGAFFGAAMAWYTARGEARLVEKGFDIGDMTPIQERQVVLASSMPEAFRAASEALRSINKIKITNSSQTSQAITAVVGATLRSFGEKVTLKLSLVEGGVLVIIHSEPRMPGTTADGGKGVENVEIIVQSLIEKGAVRRAA